MHILKISTPLLYCQLFERVLRPATLLKCILADFVQRRNPPRDAIRLEVKGANPELLPKVTQVFTEAGLSLCHRVTVSLFAAGVHGGGPDSEECGGVCVRPPPSQHLLPGRG
eukprot:7363388-Pyramimonas_sp.AAC.1